VSDREASYARVSRALRRRIPTAPAVVRVLAEAPRGDITPALLLANLLDRYSLGLGDDVASYAAAEGIVSDIEARHAPDRVQLVLLCGDAWSRCLLSAAGARAWPVVFEPLRGLSPSERGDFIRRAYTSARKGAAVLGIKPWRSADVDASQG